MLGNEFGMKELGDAEKIPGMEIHRDKSGRKLRFYQKSCVEKVLDKFDISN